MTPEGDLAWNEVNRESPALLMLSFKIQTRMPGLYVCAEPLCPVQLSNFPFRVWGGQVDRGLFVSLLVTRNMTCQPSKAPAK